MSQIIFWLVFLVVMIAIEIITLGLTTIWFAGGALVALLAACIGAPLFIQIALFIFVSVLLLIFTRPVAMRFFNKERVKTNAEGLVGRRAVVTEEIDNLKSVGQVTVSGQEWTARAPEDGMVIPEGTVVTVLAISGVKLIVEERREEM